VCGLETSRIGAPFIYDISNLRVNAVVFYEISISLCRHFQTNVKYYSTYLYLLIYRESFGISYFKFSDIISALNKVRDSRQHPSLSVEFMWV